MQSSTVVGVLMRQRLHHLLSAKLTILWPFLPFASFSSSSAADDARYIRTPTVPYYSLLPHAGFQREDKSHKVSAACSCPLFSTSTSLFRPCSLARGVLLSARLPGIGASSALTFFIRNYSLRVTKVKKGDFDDEHSQRTVTTALWCNFLVFSLKSGVWLATSSHVMLAEVVHSIADFANQALLAYGLNSSRRAPDAMHPYGYSKERFVWSLISAVGIFCIGSGATSVHGFQNLWTSQCPENIYYATLVIGGSFLIEGASLTVAITAVKKGAAAEGMKVWDYIWRGHDPTSVAVMTEDGAAVTGLAIAAASLMAVNKTGNAIYDPIGSIIVGNLLGMVSYSMGR